MFKVRILARGSRIFGVNVKIGVKAHRGHLFALGRAALKVGCSGGRKRCYHITLEPNGAKGAAGNPSDSEPGGVPEAAIPAP
jgi:hypothetical protein